MLEAGVLLLILALLSFQALFLFITSLPITILRSLCFLILILSAERDRDALYSLSVLLQYTI